MEWKNLFRVCLTEQAALRQTDVDDGNRLVKKREMEREGPRQPDQLRSMPCTNCGEEMKEQTVAGRLAYLSTATMDGLGQNKVELWRAAMQLQAVDRDMARGTAPGHACGRCRDVDGGPT